MIETEKIKTKQEIIQEKIESLAARNKIYFTISILIIGGYFYDSPTGDGSVQILFLPLSLFLFRSLTIPVVVSILIFFLTERREKNWN